MRPPRWPAAMPDASDLEAAVRAERAADHERAAEAAQAAARAAERRAAEAERDREELRERVRAEEARLEKLWDAYKAQENDLRAALDRAGRLERELKGKDVTVSEAEKLLREREDELARTRDELDNERRRAATLEMARAELADVEELRRRHDEVDALYAAEKERLAKLYVVYEELEAERDDLARRLEEKEAWFRKYEAALKDLTGRQK